MRVGAIQSQARIVDVETTHATPAQMRAAIATAYQNVTGRAPTKGALDTITAQAMVETARGTSMINYNFGGIKGQSPQGMTTRAKTVEVENGKTTHIVDGFRAYGSLQDGATDYVKLLHDRFSSAFSRADAGDVNGFAHELKSAHYFTANESDYAAALRAQAGISAGASTASAATPTSAATPASLASPASPDVVSRFSRADEISRALDALSQSAVRILGEDSDS